MVGVAKIATMESWMKIYRKFLEWEWFDKPEMVQLFIYLLLSANHKTKKWNGIQIKRGQLVTSLDNIHKKTGLSIQVIRTCISRLKSTNEITSKSTSRYTLITMCNYAIYQVNENEINKPINNETNKPLTNEQQTTNKRATTNKNDKNININNIMGVKKSTRFLPPTLEELKTYCLERKNDVDAEKFFYFYQSKGWMVGRNKMKDWRAAVRTCYCQLKLEKAGKNGGHCQTKNILY